MEVGWYLRLSKASRVEALVSPAALAALREQAAINSSWTLSEREEDGAALAVFERPARQ